MNIALWLLLSSIMWYQRGVCEFLVFDPVLCYDVGDCLDPGTLLKLHWRLTVNLFQERGGKPLNSSIWVKVHASCMSSCCCWDESMNDWLLVVIIAETTLGSYNHLHLRSQTYHKVCCDLVWDCNLLKTQSVLRIQCVSEARYFCYTFFEGCVLLQIEKFVHCHINCAAVELS